MPATSLKQRTLFCIALSKKRGETAMSYGRTPELAKRTAEMSRTMSEEQLKDYCGSKVEQK